MKRLKEWWNLFFMSGETDHGWIRHQAGGRECPHCGEWVVVVNGGVEKYGGSGGVGAIMRGFRFRSERTDIGTGDFEA